MAYGELKVDSITFTDGSSDVTVSVSGLVKNPTFSGDIVVSGNISGITITGDSAGFGSVTGVTITGTTANFVTVSGTTATGTTANFVSGVFTTQISGTAITGDTAGFGSVTGVTVTVTSGVFASGIESEPSVSVGTTNNGLYSPGTNQVALSTNGTGKLFIDSAGKVTVKGAGTAAFVVEGSAPNNSLVIKDTTGNVGIGTTNPLNTLHVNATGGAGIALQDSGSGAGVNFAVISANGTTSLNLRASGGTTAKAIVFETSTTSEAARIDSSGRLLVGTSDSFQIESLITPQVISANNTGSASCADLFVGSFQNASGSGRARVSGKLFLAHSRSGVTGSIGGLVGNNDRLGEIRFVGDDGTQLLTAAEIVSEVDGISGTDDMPGRLVFSTTADGASSPTERMRITAGGSIALASNDGSTATHSTLSQVVQIGRASGSGSVIAALNIGGSYTGDASLNIRDLSGTAASFYFGSTKVGSITLTASATAYNTSSDYRLKENVTPVTDGITRLQQLKPSRFNFIADPAKTVDGFLAHEVQTIVPEAITGEKDAVDDEGNPQYQGIDQSKIVPLVVAALQEAIAKIETLEQRLNDAGIN